MTDVDELVKNAEGDSITKELLVDSGKTRTGIFSKTSYSSILDRLDEGEQPHFAQRYELEGSLPGLSPENRPRHVKGKMRTTVVTDRRLFFYSTDSSYSVPFEKISEVEKDGTDLKVTQAGGKEAIFPIGATGKDPIEYVRNQVHQTQSTESGQEATASPKSRLEELNQMYEQDLISEEEFEEKREQILEEL